MSALEGLLHGRAVGVDGAARRIDLHDEPGPDDAWSLLALGRDSLPGRSWLQRESGLDANTVDALLEEDTRPRALIGDHGALLILRGAVFHDDGRFRDLASLRLHIEDRRVIVVQRRHLQTLDDCVAALDRGQGAAGPGAFLAALAEALREAVEPVLDRLEREVDGFEIAALSSDRPPEARDRQRLNAARRDTITIARHMGPMAQALRSLVAAKPAFLADKALRGQLRDEADAFRRIGEDLDAVRARAVVVGDEAALRVAEQTNRLILRLSVVSIIFLPLTFLTGLGGVNLDGIPYAGADWSFGAFAAACVGLAAGLAWLMRRQGLL